MIKNIKYIVNIYNINNVDDMHIFTTDNLESALFVYHNMIIHDMDIKIDIYMDYDFELNNHFPEHVTKQIETDN